MQNHIHSFHPTRKYAISVTNRLPNKNAPHCCALRILIVNLVPVLFYITGLLDSTWGILAMEFFTIGTDIRYAWVLRRVLA